MEYRRLGRTGLKVSEFCLGTMGFGRGTDETEARKQVDVAFDAGINFFDTADSYGGRGASETMLGTILKGRRRDAVVATKVFSEQGPGPNDSGLSRVHIMQALENSLRRLQMDYVDVYYLHQIDVQTPLEETLQAMDDMVHQGKVRYVACSNYPAWMLTKLLWLSDKNDLARVEAYQGQYSLVVRDLEQEVLQVCAEEGVGLTVWSPLAGGFLTGKYSRGEGAIPGTRSEERPIPAPECHANAWEILARLKQVAQDLGKSPAQVALRWVVQRPTVSAVILAGRTVEHVCENLGADGWKLEGDALKMLDEVSTLPDRYPWAMQKRQAERRNAAIKMRSLKG